MIMIICVIPESVKQNKEEVEKTAPTREAPIREATQLEVSPPPEEQKPVKRTIKDYLESTGDEVGDVLRSDVQKVTELKIRQSNIC